MIRHYITRPGIFTLLFILLNHAQSQSQYVIGYKGHQPISVTASSTYQAPGWSVYQSDPKATIDGEGLDYDYMLMARLMQQATLGADRSQIASYVRYADDIEGWIDEQASLSPSLISPQLEFVINELNSKLLDAGADSSELIIRGNWAQFNYAWWSTIMTNQDLLRHRIAYALSQLLVISMESDLYGFADGVADYYDIFLQNAFGNYEDILQAVALHPAMGYYLSHLNNPKEIPTENIHPDENFAREIMQLFTIGLYELNIDGSHKTDQNGASIPTYDQSDITELAKVFTGLGVGGLHPMIDWTDQIEFGYPIYVADMKLPMHMFEQWHEPGIKKILDLGEIPAGQPGLVDIEDAVHMLFEHPNVGPFVAQHFIKHMVKSNPSPDYIARVASAFNDNGHGVRGDLLSVIKAVLLDEEARSCDLLHEATHGKLQEPLLRYTQFARSVNKLDYNNLFWNIGYEFYDATGQSPLSSPTVFNFFSPYFQPMGELRDANLVGPEYQIHNSRTALTYINQVNRYAFYQYLMSNWEEGFTNVYTDYSDIIEMGRDPEVLINYIDKHLTHGSLSENTRRIIREAAEKIIYDDFRLDRIRMSMYLTLISPDFTVLR